MSTTQTYAIKRYEEVISNPNEIFSFTFGVARTEYWCSDQNLGYRQGWGT